MSLPAPPVLKTTIIQLNKDLESDDKNYEILTNEYSSVQKEGVFVEEVSQTLTSTKKKRRRSSANVDSDELAKRKNETKQLHSVIEKRRRIKINREFEALKYLIPACRVTGNFNNGNNTSGFASHSRKSNSQSSSNSSKIDGMYKLTILKSSVEYILYLHHIIKQQNQLIQKIDPSHNFCIDFAQVQLDVNKYRDIDKEFDFKSLSEVPDNLPLIGETIKEEQEGRTENEKRLKTVKDFDNIVDEDVEAEKSDFSSSGSDMQLPSPDITPDMAPILSMLKKYGKNGIVPTNTKSPLISSFSCNRTANNSANTSPLTIPLKSSTSTQDLMNSSFNFQINSQGTVDGTNGHFALPDPALNEASSPMIQIPRRKLFKSRPSSDVILNPLMKSSSLDDIKNTQDASKTLLALRKSSIDSLLN